MLGDTFVLPVTGGDVTLKKIKEEAYSSEYMFRDTTSKYVVKIRHTTVKATPTRPQYDRHNLEAVQTVFAAGSVPEYERKFYFVYEVLPSDTSVLLGNAVSAKAVASSNAILVALLNWES
jgi:hypothetical protein